MNKKVNLKVKQYIPNTPYFSGDLISMDADDPRVETWKKAGVVEEVPATKKASSKKASSKK